MTTDITELAQSLKAAAEHVIKNYNSEWFEAGHQICTVHKSKINLISLANPVNVLALVEALESRTVTVNLAPRRSPSDYVDGEFGNDDLAAIHNACLLECKVSVEKCLSAHGIVVKWGAE